MARKPISKKLRFDVLSRDLFTCQYCGAKSPDVVLHVDHIWPVKRGGTNDIWNLAAACIECNHGKRASHITIEREGDMTAVMDTLHEAHCANLPMHQVIKMMYSCETDWDFCTLVFDLCCPGVFEGRA